MPDRRQNGMVEVKLEYAAFLAKTRGIEQAIAYVDSQNIQRVVLWRVLGEATRRQPTGDRRSRLHLNSGTYSSDSLAILTSS